MKPAAEHPSEPPCPLYTRPPPDSLQDIRDKMNKHIKAIESSVEEQLEQLKTVEKAKGFQLCIADLTTEVEIEVVSGKQWTSGTRTRVNFTVY